jgi:hypothetical protein
MEARQTRPGSSVEPRRLEEEEGGASEGVRAGGGETAPPSGEALRPARDRCRRDEDGLEDNLGFFWQFFEKG